MKKLFRLIFSLAVSYRLYTLLSFVYAYVIEELTVDGATVHPSKHAKNNKFTILILSSEAFRKDIECIVATNELRVLRFPDHWQAQLISQFYPNEFEKYTIPNQPYRLAFKYKKEQDKLRGFLYELLARLYKRISIDCVITPHSRYVRDMDWGAVSTRIGVPHILMPRDSQIASSPATLDYVKSIFENVLPKFEGKFIIIQSVLDKEAYVDSGYAKPEQISSLGCPRMDDFVKGIGKNKYDAVDRRKKVVFLPFTPGKILGRSDLFFAYYYNVHLFFVHFALRYPEIDVVIKPKPKQPRLLRKKVVLEALNNSTVKVEEIPNLIIRDDLDLHDLFFQADVVCGLQTSALLEAAVVSLPVIIPYFKEIQSHNYDDRLFYRDYYDLFDIAKDIEELESLILRRLNDSTIKKEVMEGRIALFEKFISSVKGDATEKYTECIKQVISQHK